MEINAEFMQTLRGVGLGEQAILVAAGVGFHYNLINRVADALDYPVPTGKQKDRLAFLLNLLGKLFKGTQGDATWVRTPDGTIRPTEVQNGVERMRLSAWSAHRRRFGESGSW